MSARDPWQGGTGWKAASYAKRLIPPAKLLIGLPAYGYDWDLDDTSRDTSFAWRDVPSLLSRTGATVQFQQSSASPFITYTGSNGHRHEAWFENAQSIAAKAALAKSHGLAGISMWRLGQEDLGFWTAAGGGLD